MVTTTENGELRVGELHALARWPRRPDRAGWSACRSAAPSVLPPRLAPRRPGCGQAGPARGQRPTPVRDATGRGSARQARSCASQSASAAASRSLPRVGVVASTSRSVTFRSDRYLWGRRSAAAPGPWAGRARRCRCDSCCRQPTPRRQRLGRVDVRLVQRVGEERHVVGIEPGAGAGDSSGRGGRSLRFPEARAGRTCRQATLGGHLVDGLTTSSRSLPAGQHLADLLLLGRDAVLAHQRSRVTKGACAPGSPCRAAWPAPAYRRRIARSPGRAAAP